MSRQSESDVNRQVLATARRYRRDGYRVAMLERGDPLPGFLRDCVPDLVAERDDDRVAVMVKRADTVRGSNDIVALAQIIDQRSDWRFEFISVPAGRSIAMPNITTTRDEMNQLASIGHTGAAFALGCSLIESVITATAARHGLRPDDLPFAQLVRKLVVLGIISNEMRATVIDAMTTRDKLLVQSVAHQIPSEAVARLSDLADLFLEEAEAA